MINRRADQEQSDRYPGVPRFALASAELGQVSMHVGDLSYLPGYGVPHHYHTGGAEETQIMLEGELECWVDGKRVVVGPGDTVTAPPGTGHAFHNRSESVGRMITVFPVINPETIHIDDPELNDATEHPAIIKANSRRTKYATGAEGIDKIELSGDFSGAKSTYTHFLDIPSRKSLPIESYDHEVGLFVVSGKLVGVAGEDVTFDTNDCAVVGPGQQFGFANQEEETARLLVIHPKLNPFSG